MNVLRCCFVLLVLLGCGDDVVSTMDASVDGGASEDAVVRDTASPGDAAGVEDAGSSDVAVLDAAVLDDANVDAGVPVDAGNDAGPEASPGSEFFDARASAVVSLCACPDIAAEFASTESCVGLRSESPLARPCFVEAASSLPSLDELLTCLALNEQTFGTCVGEASCDESALNACRAAAFDGIQGCGFAGSELLPLAQTQAECLVGEPGMCPADPAPTSNTGDAVFIGDNVRAGNDRPFDESSCHSNGPDRSHTWIAPSAGEWVMDTLGSDFPARLGVYADCDSDIALACSENRPIRDPASLTLTLEAGQSVVVVVDGFNGTLVGNYVVNIRPQ